MRRVLMPQSATAPSTRLTVLGSGDAFSGCGCNAAYVVDDHVLIDCGAPVQTLLPRAGMAVASLDLVLITHFHADHTYMLPMLLGARAFAGELRPGLTIGGLSSPSARHCSRNRYLSSSLTSSRRTTSTYTAISWS